MKSLLITILLCYCVPISLYNQSCHFNGFITDEKESPLEFVTIGVYNDTTFIVGTTTEKNGEFNLTLKCDNSFNLVIRYIGYELIKDSIYTKNSSISKSYQLKPTSNNLQEITVKSKKPSIERKADRLIYFVDTSFVSNNSSALEVLKTTPSIWVDKNGNITINGKSQARVMINGKFVKMNSNQLQTYLNGLDGTQILKVEVISIPGSEYEAESKGGIVNVILKKKFLDGYNANIFLGYEQGKFPEYSAGIFSNYKKKKLTATANFYLFQRNSFIDINEIRENISNSFNLNTSSYSKTKVNNNQLRLGSDYDFSINHNLNYEYVRTYNQNNFDTEARSNLFNNDSTSIILGLYDTKSTNIYQGNTLNYQWKIDTLGSNLIVLIDYINNNNKTEGLFLSDYFTDSNIFIEKNNTANESEQISNIFSGKIDYEYYSFNNSTLRIGTKYSQSDIDNDVVEKEEINNEFIVNPFRTNSFTYKESIFAAYVNYSSSVKVLKYKIGMRIENANVSGNSIDNSGDFKAKYLDWFPSGYLLWEFGKSNALSFAINRRISRPSFEALNPFEYVLSEFTILKGNPALRPEYTTNVELNYNLSQKYNLNVFHSKTDDIINRVLIANQNQAIYQNLNISKQNSYGINIGIPFIPIKNILKSYLNFTWINNHYESDIVDESKSTFTIKMNNNIGLNNGLQGNLSFFYSSNGVYGNFIYDSYWQMDATISKSFFKNKIKVSIGVQDIFNSQNNNIILLDSEENITSNEKVLTQKLQFYIFYNFNIGDSFKKKNIKYSTDGETGRLKG